MDKIESQISKDKSLVERIRELSGVVILSKREYEELVQKQAGEDVIKTLRDSINALTNQLNTCIKERDYYADKCIKYGEELEKRCKKWWKF